MRQPGRAAVSRRGLIWSRLSWEKMRTSCPAIAVLPFLLLNSIARDGTATLTGTVRSVVGEAIPGAVVELRLDDFPGDVLRARADDSGIFRFAGVTPGKHTMKVSSPGFAMLFVQSIFLSDGQEKVIPPVFLTVADLACSGHAVLQTLRLQPPDQHAGSLFGSVYLDRGTNSAKRSPVADASVTLLCAGGGECGVTKTDVRGEFAFSDLAAGRFTVRVKRRGFYSLDMPEFLIQDGFEAHYWPIGLERCRLGDCDPRRRPRKPVVWCE
jgi:hypothetical protein